MTKEKIIHDLSLITTQKILSEHSLPPNELASFAFDTYKIAFDAIAQEKENEFKDLLERYESV